MHAQARTRNVPQHTHGAGLTGRFGIVAGTVQQYAAELGVAPDVVLSAVCAAGIEPMVDTAQNASRRETHDRPRDPSLRCLAMTSADFARLIGQLTLRN